MSTCVPCPKTNIRFPPCFQLHSSSCQKKNPGSIQNLHILAHQIMPKFFDGLELTYNHRLTANKFINCNWILSHTRPSGFRFGGTYTMRMLDDFTMLTPTITADINPSTLASNVSFVYYPLKCLRFEAEMQRVAKDNPLMTQSTIELTRPCTTVTANFYNVRSDSGRSTLSFMRSITQHWALGSELLIEWRDKKFKKDLAVAARYSHHNHSVAATVSWQGLDISYWQRIHQRIQMASLLAWNKNTKKTIATVCYQWDFDEVIVRGMFDSDMSVGFMYYRTLSHIPLGLGVSMLISLPTNRFIFGMKFNLDPSGLRRGD